MPDLLWIDNGSPSAKMKRMATIPHSFSSYSKYQCKCFALYFHITKHLKKSLIDEKKRQINCYGIRPPCYVNLLFLDVARQLFQF